MHQDNDNPVDTLRHQNSVLRLAISRSLASAATHSRPDGIDAEQCIDEILAAIDNDEVKAVMEDRI